MAGRKKGQGGVGPELRREWLQLYEESGLSAKSIGERYHGYTGRTVSKHLNTARQERERKETRHGVLKDALQAHYKELLQLLERAQALVAEGESVREVVQDRRWRAIMEHLPKLPLWRHLTSWEEKQDDISKAIAGIGVRTAKELCTMPGFRRAFASLDIAVVVNVFEEQARTWRKKSRGLDIVKDLKITPGREGMANVKVRAYDLGECKVKASRTVEKALHEFREKLQSSPEVNTMIQSESRLRALASELDEELATIILRRVLPGHCKYCPI